MISNENLGSIMGAPVVGPDGDRIGTVGQVFVDPTTGSPNWATVHTGLFGRRETFIPLSDADWDHEVLRIPYEKGLVKDAPRLDTDEAFDPQAEDQLYRYYGVASADSGEASDAEASAHASPRLRKYVVTEQQEPTVPVTQEEARPVTEPAGEDPADSAAGPGSTNSSERKQRGRHRA